MKAFTDVRYFLGSHPYVVGGLILITFFAIFKKTFNSSSGSKGNYPLAGYSSSHLFPSLQARLGWFHHGATFIDDAFVKYPDEIFRVPSLNRLSLVLPPRFLSEVKDLPSSVLSNGHATADFFIGNWTTIDNAIFDHNNLDAVKAQYISQIGPQIGPAADEATYAFGKTFSSYEEWTSLSLDATIKPLVAQTAARTIVGPDLCRNPEWIEFLIGYAQSVALASVSLKLLPPFLRPLAVFLSDYHRIFRYQRRLHQLLYPQVKQLLDEREQSKDWKVRRDLKTSLEYIVEASPDHEATPRMIAHRLAGNSVGATQLTAAHIVNCILDLATHFDTYAPALRKEIEDVLGEGQEITNAHLARMWKLDSFMKESLRFHPLSKLSVNRKVMRPYRLSSGTILPVGAHVSFAGGSMSLSDTYICDAKTFDGFRFERMRLNPKENHNGLQFTSSYDGALHLGHGRQMCPGRFFGSAISKMVLVKLLQRFDLKLKDGQSRPENLRMMDMDIPHPEAEVLFRNRVI